ncbi:BirA family transcriptional regulator, biotin operon repressor / biotin-[acetyl-CoA-carboxylase] ligase [Fervidobacterium changbaicum]|uniref:Biotin--[acetyl-CoA-carboxylase] ligase n=2 Tax=Fervidobacterium TaxID=2422 RepID=A0AAI8CLM4_FERIS|nr:MULTISPECIES: biotin--[acetyl-CoA-carboxylase] ligase [Fervidobacterium]AMW33209.1 biotin--[acetyl-CoA-carboxylase] ligase [Fervidobacterium islandicum]QAV33270.1 biotin--[acetyl-CoA-carboxylase] ligase [Fervidobacterium changbaicum]SDH06778.1 BirA family transcriptional regulator, biotin operon repressor / biotin-[acetyl-CoA-carboxylase] ligase [Fervidobacterium changbaicum]
MIGEEIEVLYEVDSTNEFLKRNYKSFHDGAIVVAIKQTAGKGRMGRTWYSPEGGLWYSVLFKPKVHLNLHVYTKIFSIAIVEVLRKLKVKAYIKWPNDIYYNGKKVAGILSEAVSVNDRVIAIIVGIGINVNNDIPEDLKDIAISLKDILKKKVKITYLLDTVNKHAWNLLITYRNETENITKLWKKYLVPKEGDKLKVKVDDQIVEGTVLKIGDDTLYIDVGGKVIGVQSIHQIVE